MSRRRVEEVLDACVADILGGRQTVSDCLARWPELRDELAPLLEAAVAMHRTPRVAERRPDPARRAQLMAALRSTPQQPPRREPVAVLGGLLASPLAAFAGLGRVGAVAASAATVAVVALLLSVVMDAGGQRAYASTLTVFSGTVEQRVGDSWRPLRDAAEVSEGSHLRTDAEGSALLTFADGSTVSIEPDTELLIERARLAGSRQVRLHQLSGRLWNDVAPDDRPGALYVVRTPDATITAVGTLFGTTVEGGETAVSAAEGTVELLAGEQRVTVAAGEAVSARGAAVVAREEAPARPAHSLRLAVQAPFAASLVAPGGKAVGARPDGIVYRQVSGATTTDPGLGPQRIEVQRMVPGTYRLLLRRLDAGEGELELNIGGREVRVSLHEEGPAVDVELLVRMVDGELVVQPIGVSIRDVIEHEERVVVTPLARGRAVGVTERRARLAAQLNPPPADTPAPAAPAESTPAAAPMLEPTAESDVDDAGDEEPAPSLLPDASADEADDPGLDGMTPDPAAPSPAATPDDGGEDGGGEAAGEDPPVAPTEGVALAEPPDADGSDGDDHRGRRDRPLLDRLRDAFLGESRTPTPTSHATPTLPADAGSGAFGDFDTLSSDEVAALAQALGISADDLRLLVSGAHRELSTVEALALAQALGVSEGDVRTLVEAMGGEAMSEDLAALAHSLGMDEDSLRLLIEGEFRELLEEHALRAVPDDLDRRGRSGRD